jgi:transcriptional antiterminator NusG
VTYKWYIVQSISGFEKKVANSIREKAIKEGISESIEDVVVPVEKVVEVRKGKKIDAERKCLPGYILVKMQMNDNIWHMIKNIPKVTGFLGSSGKPQVIDEKEIKRILEQIEQSSIASNNAISFEVGESVKVTDGPFESFLGVVEGVDPEKNRLKVSVTIFGRSTPLDLDFTQVSKV